MRDNYQTTITYISGGTLLPAAGIEITVYPVGTTANPATIYQRREGQAQGNAVEAGTQGGPNPFTTGPTGAVEFWLPPGVYDIHMRDTQAPERVQRRGYGSSSAPIQFNSMPAQAGSLPSTLIAGDAGITLASLAADVQRQSVPIGGVMYWWRPSNAVAPPLGFEISDGKVVAAGSHDFGVAGAVTLPDLRNVYIIGADILKTDGTGITNGDGSAASTAQHPNAPGIRGTGGSNALKNLSHTHQFGHTHTSPFINHNHYTGSPDHLHSAGSLYAVDHGHGCANAGGSSAGSFAGGGYNIDRTSTHAHGIYGSGNLGVGNSTGAADRGLGAWSGGSDNTSATTTNSQSTTTTDAGTSATAANMLPNSYGLLPIMKVRKA